MKKLLIYSEKYKAMERLIFLVRTEQIGKAYEVGENIGKRLDEAKIPYWKQNSIAYLSAKFPYIDADKIIMAVYYLKKPENLEKKLAKKYGLTTRWNGEDRIYC